MHVTCSANLNPSLIFRAECVCSYEAPRYRTSSNLLLLALSSCSLLCSVISLICVLPVRNEFLYQYKQSFKFFFYTYISIYIYTHTHTHTQWYLHSRFGCCNGYCAYHYNQVSRVQTWPKRRNFKGDTIRNTTFFGGEVEPEAPYRKTLRHVKVTCTHEQKYYARPNSSLPSSTPPTCY
jgi:hypothetical protein